MTIKAVKDEMREDRNHPEDEEILKLLAKGKTVFATGLTENDFRRLYGAVRRDDPEASLHRKRREVDGEQGHVLWIE